MLRKKDVAFAEGVPSLFILTSPLQTICAIEAIKKYKINIYKIILVLEEDIRNQQVFELLDKYGLEYEISNCIYKRFAVLRSRTNKYKRAFIGDPRDIRQIYNALIRCSDGACIVMMDDGDDNVFMLKGYSFFKAKNIRMRLSAYFYNKVAPFFRRITYGKDLFTIYSNIPNDNYHIEPNTFSYFSKCIGESARDFGVYFIGTNHNRFCEPQNYPLKDVIDGLEMILKKLKKDYPYDKIFYIPHGRDTASFPIDLCKKYDIQYQRPSKTVELMFIDQDIRPKVVYGFTSTALYNIKLLFPQTVTVNVVFNINRSNVFIHQTEVISEYYREQGIDEMRIEAR